MESAIGFLKQQKSDISDFISDAWALIPCSRKSTLLTEEQFLVIQKFSHSCRQQIVQGVSILETVPPINPVPFGEVKFTLNQMEFQIKEIDSVGVKDESPFQKSSRGSCGNIGQGISGGLFGGSLGGALSGGLHGFTAGAAFAPVDMGLLAAVGAVIGVLAAIASSRNQEEDPVISKILIPNLRGLVENVQKVPVLIGQAYGLPPKEDMWSV